MQKKNCYFYKTQWVIIVFSVILLSSCSAFLAPIKIHQQTIYTIDAIPLSSAHHNAPSSQKGPLLVLLPTAETTYNTTQMLFLTKDHRIAYVQKYRWADKPTNMLQALMIRTLQNANYFKAVVSPPFVGQYDYILSTHLLALQAKMIHPQSIVELVIQVELIQSKSNQVIASKKFIVRQVIHGYSPDAQVKAMNDAASIFLEQLTYFCMHI